MGSDGLRYTEKYLIGKHKSENILKLALRHKYQWIDHIQIARERSKESSKEEFDDMRKTMRMWLDGDDTSINDEDASEQ